MARNKLSETKIKSLNKPGVYSDGDGLFLRVRSGGSKQWLFIFKKDGKRTEIALGGYGQGTAPVSLSLAREKAEALRLKRAAGEFVGRSKTFSEVMDDVLDVKFKSFKNEKHKDQWRMTLTEYARPLHNMPVDRISRSDIVEVLLPIWTAIPETADRTRMRIAAVFKYAKAKGLMSGDNPADWDSGLKELLPAREKLTRGHHEALHYDDIGNVMQNLRNSDAVSARLVEFVALTAARTGEARFAVWDEIDVEKKLWTVPAERMKAGKIHRVPLVPRALEILEAQRIRSTSNLIFEGGKGGAPISDTAMRKSLKAAGGGDSTLHGLRSTFRDWAGDKTDFLREVTEAALAHSVGDAAEQAYRRGDALDKRTKLMQAWAKFCGV